MRSAFLLREAALLLVLGVMFAAFSIFVPGFYDWTNVFDRTRHWVAAGLIAIPMTFIIATAGIDLSVGSLVAMSGIVLGLLYRDGHWPIGLAVLAAIGAGMAGGALNGAVISRFGIPPLVATLATMALFSGVATGLSKGRPIGNLPASLQWLSQGDAFVLRFGQGIAAPLPFSLLVLAAATALGWVLMHRSWVGRFTEFIGENEMAARFAAIPVPRMRLGIYTACGLVCGVASVLYTGLYATARPDAARGLELEVIACVVIGGTRISGGHASVLGSLLGLFIIGMLKYGLQMGGVKSEYLIILVGILLILTAVFNEWLFTRTGGKT
ncbi:MAG: ABC transporter permease [Candidatus Hydrogenedentes bacterium]|nr:ABC transporter permease [Candidatus Hydrogenedentota bacterium]